MASTSVLNGRGPTAPAANGRVGDGSRRSEIYRFNSNKPLFAAAWSNKQDHRFRLAVGSVVERDQGNRVTIVQLNDASGELEEKINFNVEFPANNLAFVPDTANNFPDLIATSSDFLRMYRISPEGTVSEECTLNNNKAAQFSAPLTNFDWNECEPSLIGTSSIDTTCTIWQIETGQAVGRVNGTVKTQLIAHDRPVHDIAFSRWQGGKDHFATVGADGSVRMFDLRHLEHSTIVYEDPQKNAMMRLAWNKQDAQYLATFAMDSCEIILLDIRMPCNPLARLKNHTACVNGIAWAPHSAQHICTAGDDKQALIWDVQSIPRPVDDPILAYTAQGEVNQVHWGSVHKNWISICFGKTLEILRV